jgi:Concanavalin A-like lectin/glucanases superfamily
MLGAYRYQSIRNSLIGYWRPSRGPSGNTLIDSVRGNHGTLTNGPTWIASGGVGGSGYALSFDGSNDFVGIPINGLPAIDAAKTISLWCTFDGTTSRRILFAMSNAGSNSVDIEITSAFGLPVAAVVAWGNVQIVRGYLNSANANISADTWFHIVYASTGYAVSNRLFINGRDWSDSPTTSSLSGAATECRIASFNTAFPSPYYNRLIDDVAIFNRALTAPEILTLYTAGRGALDQRVNVPVVRGFDAGGGGTNYELSSTIVESADTLVATVSVPIQSGSTIDEPADSLTATVSVAVQGQSTITEQVDSLTATASVAVQSSSTITEQADTLTATASVAISASTTITEAADSLVATVQYGSGYSAETSIVEAADSITATASVAVQSSSTITEVADSLTATVSVPVNATATINELSDSLAATISVAIVSSSTITELADTVSISAMFGVETGGSTGASVQIVAYRQSIVALRNTIRAW